MSKNPKTAPNIILIMVDQMRGDCLGADGRHDIETPNLDYLAASGSRFNHAYSAVPSCLPARATLWTGMDQWHTGLLSMGSGNPLIPCDHPYTLAGELTKAGYQTQLVGKAHFCSPSARMGFERIEVDESGRHERLGLDDDYRKWFKEMAPKGMTPSDHGIDPNSWMARPWHTEEHLHPSSWTVMRALHFIKNRDFSRPFFLNVSFARPHSPYVPPDYFFHLHKGRLRPPAVGDWAALHDIPEEAVKLNAWRGSQSATAQERARLGYFGEISFIDNQIGRLLTGMFRFGKGDLNNTWFIFISDHGDMNGDHHLWRKGHAYEASARIPFIVTAPPAAGIVQRKVVDEVVELRDVMPTVLDIAGVKIPPSVTGCSLLECIQTKPKEWRAYIHGEHAKAYSKEQEMHYVTDGRRKFVWLPRAGDTGREQFFDLENDPDELKDLIAAPGRQEEIAIWKQRLIDELRNRNNGLCADGTLSCTPGPVFSVYRNKFYLGPEMEAQEKPASQRA